VPGTTRNDLGAATAVAIRLRAANALATRITVGCT